MFSDMSFQSSVFWYEKTCYTSAVNDGKAPHAIGAWHTRPSFISFCCPDSLRSLEILQIIFHSKFPISEKLRDLSPGVPGFFAVKIKPAYPSAFNHYSLFQISRPQSKIYSRNFRSYFPVCIAKLHTKFFISEKTDKSIQSLSLDCFLFIWRECTYPAPCDR